MLVDFSLIHFHCLLFFKSEFLWIIVFFIWIWNLKLLINSLNDLISFRVLFSFRKFKNYLHEVNPILSKTPHLLISFDFLQLFQYVFFMFSNVTFISIRFCTHFSWWSIAQFLGYNIFILSSFSCHRLSFSQSYNLSLHIWTHIYQQTNPSLLSLSTSRSFSSLWIISCVVPLIHICISKLLSDVLCFKLWFLWWFKAESFDVSRLTFSNSFHN